MEKNGIGARIREHRETRGMSQEELAATCLVSRQTISHWETGKTLPDIQSMMYLAQTFETTVDALIGTDAPAIIRDVSADRRELKLLWIADAVLIALYAPIHVLIDAVSAPLSDPKGLAALVVLIIIAAELIANTVRMGIIHRKHQLYSDREIADYLLGTINTGDAAKKGGQPAGFIKRHWFELSVIGWGLIFMLLGALFNGLGQ